MSEETNVLQKMEYEIEVEKETLESLTKKLGVNLNFGFQRIILNEQQLNYLNSKVDEDKNTILMRFVKLGKADIVEFLVKCDGLRMNDVNKDHETAADLAWTEKQFTCLLKLLQGDAEFPYQLEKSDVNDPDLKDFLENRDKLHKYIELGDYQSVKKALKDTKPSMYLNLKDDSYPINQSALSWAAECHQIEIFAYLINHGAKFKDMEEERECDFSDEERDALNDLLSEYFLKLEDSHILKLMYCSHSPQIFTEERREKIKNLYEYLNCSELVRLIMKVLEYEDVDIVFDFECDHTNRIYCLNNPEIYGLTVTNTKKIFIGARKCESVENVNLEVAGTLAHELCHMAIQVVYGNDANPYEKWEEGVKTEKFRAFQKIVETVHQIFKDTPAEVDPIIRSVFNNYDVNMWHSELIVRVPHILGQYGEFEGSALLQNQVNDLFQFYLTEVAQKFRAYSNPAFFTKNLCLIESLHRYLGCIADVDKDISPLKEPAKTFKNHLFTNGNISLIFTSNTRLCCLHIYHELKKFNPYHMEKKCLFFTLDCYQRNWEKIMKAFKCQVCRYMILLSNAKVLDLENVCNYFENFDGIGNEIDVEGNKKLILIVRENCLSGPKQGLRKILSYQWGELSEPYKYRIMQQNVNIKGRETALTRWIGRERISQIIQPKDMLRLTNNKCIEIGDGEGLIWKGYIKECYIKRKFTRVFIEETVFHGLPDSNALFITGLQKKDIEKVGVDENLIDWVDSIDHINIQRKIFVSLSNLNESEFFTEFSRRYPSIDTVHWLHYYQNEFYLRTTKGTDASIEEHKKEEVYSEADLIYSSKDRIILISDDPGMGKSTVITNIIMQMRETHPDWWVGRIDLNDYSHSKENPLGLANIEEESDSDYVLEVFIRMLGMKTKLEIYLFREFIKPKGLRREYKIFLDGYDEVSNLYSDNVMKLFQILIEKTTLQLWVTTRNHEKIYLETNLDTCSYSMQQFTFENQVMFLDKFWKYRSKYLDFNFSQDECLGAIEKIRSKIEDILESMEYEETELIESLGYLREESDIHVTYIEKLQDLRSRIDGLDFSHIASEIVNDSSIGSEESKFMGIPLHLFMLGNVVHDSNFRRGAYSNVHKLYTEFVEGKIRIYWKEKGKVELETNITKKMFNLQRKEIIRFHKDIAECVIEPSTHSWKSITYDEDKDIDLSVGMLTKIGDHFQFIHRTFAEFFFAEKVLEKLKSGNVSQKTLVSILMKDKYSVVVRFFYWAFINKSSSVIISEIIFEKWDMGSVMKSVLMESRRMVNEAKYLLKLLLDKMEKVCKPALVKNFICQTAALSNTGNALDSFRILYNCLTDSMYLDLFATEFNHSHIFFFRVINSCYIMDTKEVLSYILKLSPINSSDVDENVAIEKKGPKLLYMRDRNNENILFHAASNADKNVFPYVLNFLKEYHSIHAIKKFLIDRNSYQETILHETAKYFKETVLIVIRTSATVLDVDELIPIMKAKSYKGYNFLFGVVKYCKTYFFGELFEYLRVLCGDDVLREIMMEDVESLEENIVHYAVLNGEIEGLVVVLENLRHYLKEEDEFLRYVRSRSEFGTIFHERVISGHSVEDLVVLIPFVGEVIFCEMLTELNVRGQTCFHTLFSSFGRTSLTRSKKFARCVDILLNDLKFLTKVLDQMSLEAFLLATDEMGNTILHYVPMNYTLNSVFEEISSTLMRILGKTSFDLLLSVRNEVCEVVRLAEDGKSAVLEIYN